MSLIDKQKMNFDAKMVEISNKFATIKQVKNDLGFD